MFMANLRPDSRGATISLQEGVLTRNLFFGKANVQLLYFLGLFLSYCSLVLNSMSKNDLPQHL